ncbi:hypothetical protein Taro_012603, partial [Colocasia esculenta]|nr:hypothetical protein [Colocasia esculenta]
MVAISLYRGNLHRVPDVPRRWPMPAPAISLREFRLLLRRRSRALSLLEPPAPAPPSPGSVPAAVAEGSKPPRGEEEEEEEEKEEGMGDNCCPKQPSPAAETAREGADGGAMARLEGMRGEGEERGGCRDAGVVLLNPASTSTAPEDISGPEDGGNGNYNSVGETGGGGKVEASSLDTVTDAEERKKDLKQKLDVLNEKKHHLVQMLKQILNAEDEIKKRISVQTPSVQASIPLQAEATINTSSVTKLTAPRMNIEVNFGSDVGMGGESEEIISHTIKPCHSQQMYNTSPSSASPLNRPVHGFLRHTLASTPRASSTSTGTTSSMLLGNSTGSPSHFAPAGQQGHTTNLPSVSTSATHYFASSPSPAASGVRMRLKLPKCTCCTWAVTWQPAPCRVGCRAGWQAGRGSGQGRRSAGSCDRQAASCRGGGGN